MYTSKQNNNQTLEKGHLYFIEKWAELTKGENKDFQNTLRPSSRSLIKEFLDTTKLAKKKVLYNSAIQNLITQLIYSLRNDKILKKTLSRDYNFIIGKLESLQGQDVKDSIKKDVYSFVESFYRKLNSIDIPALYAKHFEMKFENAKYGFVPIDEDLKLLISDLLFDGHSLDYLYAWGEKTFIQQNGTCFYFKIKKIASLGLKNSKLFRIIVEINFPKFYDDLSGFQNGNIQIFRSIKQIADVLSLKQEQKELLESLSTDNSHFAKVSLEAADEYSALKSARDLLLSRLSLFSLSIKLKTYFPTIRGDFFIYNEEEDTISIEKSTLLDEENFKLVNAPKYIDMVFSYNQQEAYHLMRLMEWLRVVQDSPKETGFLAIWSMLELLFVSDFENKYKTVENAVCSYILHYYVKKTISETEKILKGNIKQYIELCKFIKQKYRGGIIYKVKGTSKKRRQVINKKYLLRAIYDYKEDILKLFEGSPIQQRSIHLLYSITETKSQKKATQLGLFYILEELKRDIQHDLQRAYRIRNILTHEATIPSNLFDEVHSKMLFYLQIILEDVFYSIAKQKENTLEQIVNIKQATFSLYQKEIESIHKKIMPIDSTDSEQDMEELLDPFEFIIFANHILL